LFRESLEMRQRLWGDDHRLVAGHHGQPRFRSHRTG
jgi:hypothetical protein